MQSSAVSFKKAALCSLFEIVRTAKKRKGVIIVILFVLLAVSVCAGLLFGSVTIGYYTRWKRFSDKDGDYDFFD